MQKTPLRQGVALFSVCVRLGLVTPDQIKQRRRRERWLVFSPGEWLWVVATFAVYGVLIVLG